MSIKSRVVPALVSGAILGAVLAGCAKSPESVDPKTLKVASKSGAQLWADNCARCHDARPLTAYSDAQWEIVAHHMRLQANLTGAEQRAIQQFLQASN